MAQNDIDCGGHFQYSKFTTTTSPGMKRNMCMPIACNIGDLQILQTVQSYPFRADRSEEIGFNVLNGSFDMERAMTQTLDLTRHPGVDTVGSRREQYFRIRNYLLQSYQGLNARTWRPSPTKESEREVYDLHPHLVDLPQSLCEVQEYSPTYPTVGGKRHLPSSGAAIGAESTAKRLDLGRSTYPLVAPSSYADRLMAGLGPAVPKSTHSVPLAPALPPIRASLEPAAGISARPPSNNGALRINAGGDSGPGDDAGVARIAARASESCISVARLVS